MNKTTSILFRLISSSLKSDEFYQVDYKGLIPMGDVIATWGPVCLAVAGITASRLDPSLSEDLKPVRSDLALILPLHLGWRAITRGGHESLASMMVKAVLSYKAEQLHDALDALNTPEADHMRRSLRAGTGLYVGWLRAEHLPRNSLAALEYGETKPSPLSTILGLGGIALAPLNSAMFNKNVDNPWVEVAFVSTLAGIAAHQFKRDRPLSGIIAGVGAAIVGARVTKTLWERWSADLDI